MDTREFSADQKKTLSAVCGLFCPSCIVYITQRESPEKQKQVAESFKIPLEILKCDGCRGENRFYYCEHNCQMAPCAAEKGVDFCGQCEDYPCETIKIFQAEMPHRIELWSAQDRIREVGYEKWFDEMLRHYSCPECQAINSAYHPACRECGTRPSCKYVEQNRSEIEHHPFFKNRRPSR